MIVTLKEHYRLTFSTLLYKRKLEARPELNAALQSAILTREAQGEGLSRSNEGGWHSETDLLKWPEPEVAELSSVLRAAVKEYWATEQGRSAEEVRLLMRLEAWATVFRRGGFVKPHVHPNANVSGVYYVDAGEVLPERPNSGALSFLDPRNRPGMFETAACALPDAYTLTPESGLLVLFPAWLYHYVHPYLGSGERVSIAFNASIHQVAESPQG